MKDDKRLGTEISLRHIHLVLADPSVLRTLKFILTSANYKVTATTNSKEAFLEMQKARDSHHPIELFITDIQMLGLTGLQFIDEIQSQNRHLPILVMTGYRDKELAATLMHRSGLSCLEKPFDEKVLVERVDLIFEKVGISAIQRNFTRDCFDNKESENSDPDIETSAS